MTELTKEEIIEPSHVEKLLLLETDRAQKAVALYAAALDKEISALKEQLKSIEDRREEIVAKGNSSYNAALSYILRTYGVASANIDFKAPNGPIINVISKIEEPKEGPETPEG